MFNRHRRLRTNQAIRDLMQETTVTVNDLIYPIFVVEGTNQKQEIKSMPEVYRYSIDRLDEELNEVKELGIKALLIFGVTDDKDEEGTSAYIYDGIVQQAVSYIKSKYDFYIITDVCMCQYTSHGHCGILTDKGDVDNDKTLPYLAKIALSHVRAGADMVAPSDMMDGRIQAIRELLDENGYVNTPIMSYSAKYASSFYGPFRDVANSAPSFGDRKTYQMDFANSDESLAEVASDLEEGADIVMVKPAMTYLDIIRRIKDNFNVPIAAYHVSGEYSMLKFGIQNGFLSENAIYESIIAMKRAGAKLIITYCAKDIARKLRG